MTLKKFTTVFFLLLTLLPVLYAQTNPVEKGLAAITKEAVQGQLEFLASDWTEGREATTKGEFMSADYIASMFKIWGLKPAGDDVMPSFAGRRTTTGQRPPVSITKSFFQNIPFLETEPGSGEQIFALIEKDGVTEKKYFFSAGTDFFLTPSSVGVEYTAPVVFVGYGFKSDVLGYDDFKGIDVKGKIIIRLSGLPGLNDDKSEAYKKLELGDIQKRMALTRGKNETAQKMGAIGVIEINTGGAAMGRGGRGGQLGQASNFPFRFNSAFYEGDTPLRNGTHRISLPEDTLRLGLNTLNVSQKITTQLLKDSGIKIDEFEKNVSAKLKPASKELKGKYVYLKTSIKTKTVIGRNVVGMIEGENPNEVIVVGGHYDHMGMYQGYVWNGADDNASGTVGVMTIAKAVMATGIKPKKTIIFAAWTGEEKGLLGSKYFVEKFKPVQNIKLNLNYDMIARNVDADTAGVMVGIQYSEKYPILKEVVEKANENHKLGLKATFRASLRPTGGSDFSSFSAKDIPVYGFMAAMHPDYHQPTDHIDKVDYKKMTNIIKVGFLAIWEFANMDKIEPVK